MPNDFSDVDCKAVWNFESGALTTDSKGGNTLVNQGVDEDLVDYKQGSCSARFVRANVDRMYITDANLDSGFPLKSGETNRTFSSTFWLYLETIDVSHYLIAKTGSGLYSFIIFINGANNKISFWWSSDGASWNAGGTHASALSINTWYHVAVTRDDSDNSYRIRIWDDTAEEILGTDLTGTSGDIYIGTGTVYISYPSSIYAIDGNEDEQVVWARALSVADIDAVRAGTYSAGTTVEPATLQLALTQEAPTVVFPLQTVLPDTFQLALTQHAPGFSLGHTVSIGAPLALALTRHAPGFSLGHTVSIGAPLALALTLQVPTVTFPLQTVLPDPFSLALAQETPVIITGDVCIVLVDSALELALAVEAPTILKNTLSWSAGLLTYKGITYEISAGVTQKKFVYWDPNYTTVFRATDVLQDIFDADGWVMCLNESGVAYPAFARKLIHGGIIQAGTITAEYGQIAALTVGGPELKDLAVSSGKIADLAVNEAKLAALAVSEGKLAALSVSSAKIQALAVSEAKLAALAVSEGKLAALSVSSAKIQALAVTAAKIQDLAVDSAKINNLAVTTIKIGNLNVTTPKIADNAVTVLASNYTEGQIVVAITDTTIQTVTFTSTGEAVSIHVSALLDDSSSSGNIEVKLMEGANEVYAEIVLSVSNSMPVPLSFTIEDTPGAGEITYDLVCRGVGGARRAARRSMMIREVLK